MLTPQEVSARSFTKTMMGGYNMTMVDEFLDELTEDYTSLYKENTALKAKMKVLAEAVKENQAKVEEYRATEDSMRAALLAAQRMADSIVKEAEEKRDGILQEAEDAAREKLVGFRKDAEQCDKRLQLGQEELQRFIAESRALCEKQLKFLDEFPTMPLEKAEDGEDEAGVVEEIEEKILSASAAGEDPDAPRAESAPEQPEPPAGPGVVDEVFRVLVAGPQGAESQGPGRQDAPQQAASPARPAAPAAAPTPSAEKLLDTLAAAEQETEDLSATRRVNINELKFGPNYRGGAD